MLKPFLDKLSSNPESVSFNDTMAVIDEIYTFTPTAFENGGLANEAGQNSGSCKIFAFAKLNQLDEASTLQCFGDYYRVDVLENPTGDDHQNIRNFITHGWDGIRYDGQALKEK